MLFGSVAPGAVTADAPFQAPHLASDASVRVALQGGPIWLDGIEPPSPAVAILDAYRARGIELLRSLTGRFALVLDDREADRVILALDRMGIERLAWATRGSTIVFASSAAAVARSDSIRAALRPQALFDCLMLHMVPAPDTAYEGVFKLRPGTAVIIEQGRVSTQRYWTPAFAMPSGATSEELSAELVRALEQAVARCRPDERTGAFLSGGLDSSTVVGMLARVQGQRPRTFSIGFGVDSFDELEYARIAARRFNAVAHEYDVTPDDVVDSFARIAAAFDEPFGNSSVVPTYLCAKLAADHGIDNLLAGDGGDELFGGNERYARQRVFERYGRLPGMLRHRIVEPVVGLIDPETRLTWLRKLRSYVDQARIPMPERLESWNYMYRNDMGAMLMPDFRAEVDTRSPLRVMAALYAEAPTDDLLQRMLFYDWHYTLSDNDLRKVGTMCRLAGIKVSYPMLDPDVIDLSLRVVPQVMMRGGELRSFYKRALRGILPDEILRKPKHGFGLPFGVWLKTHSRLRDLVFGMLSDLGGRGIVRPEFLQTLMSEQRHGDPGYYGYAIWDLAMLEAWLRTH